MLVIQTLLRSSIDYAGLFPPAGLDMQTAVDNYALYRAGPAAWALARFILPAGRLSEFEVAAARHLSSAQSWQLSALAGPNLPADLQLIAAFNLRRADRGEGTVTVDTVEAKATSVSAIAETMRQIPDQLQAYIEIPIEDAPGDLIAAIATAGARAKVRTGGITRDAFPRSADLVRFLLECVRARVSFKATAGLHHALGAEYRLTYASDSKSGPMFGFLNLFLAAAFLRAGMDEADAQRVLEESSAQAFHVGEREITWRNHRLDITALREARRDVVMSFGSCSFTEPLSELQTLHLLEPRAQRA
jgi:hypothetical protein